MSNIDKETQMKIEDKDKKQRRKNNALNFLTNLTDADKQRFVTFLGYLVIILVAVLSSYLQVKFGVGEEFKVATFITNLCFNIVIGVLALMLSLKDGRLSNETRKKGELYETKREFKQKSNQIVDTDAFRQWNDKNYESERLDYIMSELSKINIYDVDYLYVTDKELKSLLENPAELLIKRDGQESVVQLDQIDEYQYDMISFYRSGKFQFKKIPYSFFKSSSGKNNYKYFADTDGKDKKIELFAYVYRIAMIVIFSIIISFSLVNPTGASGRQVAFDTASRVGNAVLSVFMGYSLAHDEMRRLIDSLLFKIEKIDDYLIDIESGKFVPINRTDAIALKIKEIRERRMANEKENKQASINPQADGEKPLSEPKNAKDSVEPQVEEVEIEMTEEEYQAYIKKQSDSLS